MQNKPKINYVEMVGNVVKAPEEKNEVIFLRIGVWNGKDHPTLFFDIAFFKMKKEISELEKGERIHIKGKLSILKDKQTQFAKLGITGLTFKKIEKTLENQDEENNPKKEIPWDENVTTS